MQNLMTQRLFNAILATCLLFGSLYLSAYAAETGKTESQAKVKKTPDAYFSEGNTCLEQSNLTCANLALANIPSLSPYAKLLQGSIALNGNHIDDAMQLLLPLQAEKHLSPAAAANLHHKLAAIFESLDDTPQAIHHLMQAKSITTTSNPPDAETKIAAIHQNIWLLLSKQGQNELIAMRGNNTDNDFQGWIDLCLASKNQDPQTGITDWLTNYPDHGAAAFAKTLVQNANTTQASINLSKGKIAIIASISNEIDAAKADAFKSGLQITLSQHGLGNEIVIHTSTGNDEGSVEQYMQAKNDGADYFVTPHFNRITDPMSATTIQGADKILHIGLDYDAEARLIADFAGSHAMLRITIVTTGSAQALQMAADFRTAWQNKLNLTEQNDQIHIITLPEAFANNPTSLPELKVQLAASQHDMLLLAMPATDAGIVRPYLNISTPTFAFSAANENPSNSQLNAVRFADMPFLTHAKPDNFSAYREAGNAMKNNELRRWFALGADLPHLLAATQHNPAEEASINGLAGTFFIDVTGNIQRQPALARFTFDGIELEK